MNEEKSPMECFVSEIIVNQAKNTMINSIRNTDDIEWLKQEFEKTLREKWEKDKQLNDIKRILKECKMLYPHEFDWEEQVDNMLNIIERSNSDN